MTSKRMEVGAMPNVLDHAGLERLAGLLLVERHPLTKDGAYKLLKSRMGAYLNGTGIAARAVDAYFSHLPVSDTLQ